MNPLNRIRRLTRGTSPSRTRALVSVGLALAVVFAAGCSGGSQGGSGDGAVTEINVLTWAGYHKPEWIAGYEKETGVKIRTQEMTTIADGFAKVQANPAAFDIVVATSGYVENYVDADLIVPFDESKVPNIKNLSDDVGWRSTVTYKDQMYGLTYAWGSQMLTWNDKAVPGGLTSWDQLWDPRFAGRVSMVDDPMSNLPNIALGMGIKNPAAMQPNTPEWDRFKARVLQLRPQVSHTAASTEDQTTDFVSGQSDVGILYSMLPLVQANNAGVPMKQTIPDTGAWGWTDNYAITKAGSAKGQAVYDFINYTMSVPWLARMAADTGLPPVLSISAAESPEAVKAGLTPEKLDATQLGLAAKDPNYLKKIVMGTRMANLDAWIELWNEFGLAKG